MTMARPNRLLGLGSLPFLVTLISCGDRSVEAVQGPGDDVGYTDTTDVVVAGPNTWIVTGDPDGCVQIGDQCLDIPTIKQQECGDANAQADIVVVGGKVVEVVCYPPLSSGVSIDKVGVTAEGTTAVPQNANQSVITFAPETNGKPLEGNVTLNAENISIIGNGIDRTMIKGNLTLDSNNAHVRGLTVTGNLVLDKNSNGATVAFVRVNGNLVISSNNVVILNTIVFGNLESKGQSPSLINVGVAGTATFAAAALVCDSNYSFADANKNGVADPAEKSATPLACTVPK